MCNKLFLNVYTASVPKKLVLKLKLKNSKSNRYLLTIWIGARAAYFLLSSSKPWLVTNTCFDKCPVAVFSLSPTVTLCSFFSIPEQCDRHSSSTWESPPSYRALQLGWIGPYKWDVPRGVTPVPLFWVCTLFRLGLYLFRCKSACKECYVLSLCSGRQTGTHLLEEVSPVEIGTLQIVFHYKSVIDVSEGVTSCSLTLQGCVSEKELPHPFFYLLLSVVRALALSS